MKIVKKIQLKIVIFTAVKNRCILHGRVFVMVNSLGHAGMLSYLTTLFLGKPPGSLPVFSANFFASK